MRTRGVVLAAIVFLVLSLSGCAWLFQNAIVVSPGVAAVHTVVTIRGQGFGAVEGTVSIWSLPAPIVSWSDTEVVCRVPLVPTPGGVPVETLITVRSRDLEFYDDAPFTVVRGILFASTRSGKPQIYVMNPDGSGQTNLSESLVSDSEPAWYPNGSRFVFEASSPTNAPSLRTMNADGTSRAILTDNPLHDEEGPRWSPTGLQIVYASELGGGQQLFTIRPDGSDMQQLTHFGAIGVDEPSWSPDGSQLVFVVAHGIAETDSRLVVRSIDQANSAYITEDGKGAETPAWSPDGEWIAYSRRRRDGGSRLMLIRPDGTDERELTGPAIKFATHPTWSPDGSAIVFHGYREEGPLDIFLIDLETESIVQLTNDPAVDSEPFWFN